MTHYFITNRKVSGKTIHEDGDETAQDSLRFGEYDVKTKKYQLYPDKRVTAGNEFPSYANKSFDSLGSGRFFKSLYDAMSAKDGGDVLVFVHGFDTNLKGAWENITDLHNKYVMNEDCPVKHIVIFTWPGKDLKIPLHYRNDFKDAERSGNEFYRAVKMFAKFNDSFFRRKDEKGNRMERCNNKIHLMCHSMGHVVLRSMFRESKNYSDPVDSTFSEVLLMAANIEWDDLQPGKDMENIGDLCDRAHIYFNNSDNVLDVARYTKRRFRKQLGRYGVKDISQMDKNVFQVETTKLKKDEKGLLDHWYYFASKMVVADVTEVLKGQLHPEDIKTKNIKRKIYEERSYKLIKSK